MRETGGVVVLVIGAVLVIAGIRGTLGKLWHAVVTDAPDSGGSSGGGAAANPVNNPGRTSTDTSAPSGTPPPRSRGGDAVPPINIPGSGATTN